MKKRLLSVILSAALLCGGTIPAMAADGISVTLNGEELTFDVPPVNIDGRVMVPMRGIFEALGAEVEWYEEDQSIYASDDYVLVSMQIGDPLIFVDFEEITLDVAPQLVNDRTMVPVRAVSEAFDAEVTWDAATETVAIKAQVGPLDPSQITLTETFSLMGGRMSIDMPSQFEYSETEDASETSSNIVFLYPVNTKMPLSVVVTEQFELSSGDIEKDGAVMKSVQQRQGWTLTTSNISDENKQAVKLTPATYPDMDDPAIYLNSALIKTADDLLIYVEIDIDAAFFEEKDRWLPVTDAILQSIQPGTKSIDRSARKVAIGDYTMDLPADYACALRTADDVWGLGDYRYYDIQKIRPFTESLAPTISVEISSTPYYNFEYSEIKDITRTVDKLGGKSILWSSYKDTWLDETLWVAETIFPAPGSEELMMKVLVLAATEAEFNEMKTIAKTLTLSE